MYFKRLEMHGFKSFAEPVVIEFHEGVTCIVGPNGSGKSNISDAIRWVLGEQSPKMLRGGKMEEVIFAGTASRKSRGMAEVTLVIDNSTGILPIDYSEVAITRRMYRSGESEYLINNNQCRLRDIKELIMDTGIGVDGYSIIGQGKIADIVSNKPESRREIFEEAAGVVMYKSKKAEAERKLANTNANLERVNDIVGEIEGRIDGLKEDSIKAKEYLELREKYQELEINITLKNIEKLDLATETLKDDIKELECAIDDNSEKKDALNAELTEARGKNENLESLGNEARDNLLKKVEEINRIRNKSQLDQEKLSAIERDLARLEGEIADLTEKEERENSNLRGVQSTLAEAQKKKDEAEKALQNRIEAHSEAARRASELSGEIDDANNRMISLQNSATGKRSEARSLESYRKSLEDRKNALLSQGEEFTESQLAYEKEKREADAEKDRIEKNIATKKQELSDARAELTGLQSDVNSLTRENEDLRIQAGQKNSRKKTIEEMENNYEGYNGAVRFIMKAGIAGIEGVVADIINVPAGLEAAIETALGAGMQNIVCKSDEDAKHAIKLLKQNRAGRLTFLPISSIRASVANVPEKIRSNSGFKGLACDLVKYEEKYEGIFEYLLGRVAVVEDMDAAVSLSKLATGGLRFVTLEGEIINASGAITGGKYKNQTANLLSRKSEIDKLASEIEELKAHYQKNKDELEQKKARAQKLISDCSQLEDKINELGRELITVSGRIDLIEQNFEGAKDSDETKKRELAGIEEDFANLEKNVAGLLAEAKAAEDEIASIEQNATNLADEYEKARDKVSAESEEITQARIKKTSCEGECTSAQQLIDRIETACRDLKSQIDAKKEETIDLEKEQHSIIYGGDDSAGNLEEMEAEKERLEGYIDEIASERTELAERITKVSGELNSLVDGLNQSRDSKYQMEIKLAKNETQLENFKQNLWDDFEISYAQALTMKKENFVLSSSVKESREIKNRIKELGDVNVGAIKEYEQISTRYEFLTEQRADILAAMSELQAIISDMDKTIKTKFKENFDQVVVNFESIFAELFGGGHAELRLDNEDNPLESGIEIIAQPPGKKLQNINLMSGGEKTMTAIALMFAVLKTKPTPFCILDEVEAALDDANIDRFAKYLRNFNEIQFAIVTHQKATMEHADVLYGVTMPEQGISKVLSLRLGDDFDI